MTSANQLMPSRQPLPPANEPLDSDAVWEPSLGEGSFHPDTGSGGGMNAAFLWKVTCRWWKIAIPLSLLLATAGSLLVIHLFKPVYRASALVKIEDHAPYVAYPDKGGSDKFVQTQLELLRNPLVLKPALNGLEETHEDQAEEASIPSVEDLQKQIKLTQVGQSELYEVQYDNIHPKTAAAVINGVLQSYIQLHRDDNADESSRVLQLLEKEMESKSKKLNELRVKALELSKRAGVAESLTEQSSSSNPRSASLRGISDQLADLEVERHILEAKVAAFSELANDQSSQFTVSDLAVQLEIDKDAEIQRARSLVAEKKTSLQQVSVVSSKGKDDPYYKRMAAEIDHHQQALDARREEIRPRIIAQLQQTEKRERQREIVSMRATIEGYKSIETTLQERYKKEVRDLRPESDDALELEFAKEALEREERVFDLVARRSHEIRTESHAPERIEIMSYAASPKLPVEPLPMKYLAVVLALSFSLPFGLALIWERAIQRIDASDGLHEHTKLDVVGEVSTMPTRRLPLLRKQGKRALLIESIDSLRTQVVLASRTETVQVLAITSAVAREGKTSVATQLAVSLARSVAEPVLLVDGDLRSPDVHRIAKSKLEPGLAEVLEGKCSPEEACVTGWSDHLHVLPAGKLQGNPHRLFQQQVVTDVIEHLRQQYRYIVIDTPPILSASESLVLAKEVDGVLLCARQGHSRGHHVRRACDRLLATGVNAIGTVLSGVPARKYKRTYGTYRYR